MKKIFLAIVLFAITLPACTKYKDGPKISLLTKKARFAGIWTIESVSFNGNDITSSYNQLTPASEKLAIQKSGGYGYAGDYGTWKFGEDKDDVTFTSSLPNTQPKAYHLLRLESKSLWMQYTATNGDKTEMHFKQ